MQKRKDGRLGVQLPGSYRTGDKLPRHVFISQLSANGCRLYEDAAALEIGDYLEVSLGAVETLNATVKWKKESMIGVEFQTPLDDIVVQFFAAYCSNAA